VECVQEEKMIKAVGLFSGGLDSMLAVKLMKEQGIDVDVLQYRLGFESLRIRRRTKKQDQEVSKEEVERQLGVNIQHPDVTEEFLQIVFHPKYGYGSAMNPCIDCKIFILKKAKEYMEAHDAQFIFTGEVLGQRPMSQHRQTLLQTEKASGLQGYLLRPLSAKLLDPTIPEQEGWVDREQLFGISGRSRAVQMELAQKYNFRYPQPAGGCLLTDNNFAKRLHELMTFKPTDQITIEDITLLKLGRHFHISETVKVIIGRHETDNSFLQQHTSGRWYATVREYEGPFVLIEGEPSDQQLEHIAQLTVSYTKGKNAERVIVDFYHEDQQRAISIVPKKMKKTGSISKVASI
jgi:tRNA U34 2-thiouridine synthase MnmA/TrmU